jgi:hypothetical protein
MRSLVVGLVVSVALVACGDIPAAPDAGGDAGIDAPTDPCDAPQLSVDQFFTCVSRTFCDVVSDCLGGDVAHLDCDDLPLVIFDDMFPPAFKRLLANSDQAGRAQWNPTAAATCLAHHLRDAQCELFSKGIGDEIFQCGAIVGNVLDGAACQADFECATPGARVRGARRRRASVRRPGLSQARGDRISSCTDEGFVRPRPTHCVRARVGTTTNLDLLASRRTAGAAVRRRRRTAIATCSATAGATISTAAGTCTASQAGRLDLQRRHASVAASSCASATPTTTTGICTRRAACLAPSCDAIMGCFGGQHCAGPTRTSSAPAPPRSALACAVRARRRASPSGAARRWPATAALASRPARPAPPAPARAAAFAGDPNPCS